MMKRIQHRKLSDVITEQLETMVLDGTLVAGQKLPPERELAERFDVSRPSLREAIQNLEAKGLVSRKQGGGTFVRRDFNSAMTDPLTALVQTRPETQFDLLEFRHALEGMAAYYAALRGQPEDYKALSSALAALPVAKDMQSCADAAESLSDFYLIMAKASYNMVLTHVMRTMRDMLRENIQRNLQMLIQDENASMEITSQRILIVEAILSQDPEAARDASHKHLAFIEDTLLNINRRDSRVQRALRRIDSHSQ